MSAVDSILVYMQNGMTPERKDRIKELMKDELSIYVSEFAEGKADALDPAGIFCRCYVRALFRDIFSVRTSDEKTS